MTNRDKIRFIKNHAAAFVAEMVSKVEAGKVPEEWDGHELRVWFADKVNDDARCSLIRRAPRSARAKDYNNTIYCSNL